MHIVQFIIHCFHADVKDLAINITEINSNKNYFPY